MLFRSLEFFALTLSKNYYYLCFNSGEMPASTILLLTLCSFWLYGVNGCINLDG